MTLKSQVLLNLIVQNTNLFGLFYLVGIERVSGLAVQTWSRSPRCRPFFPRVGKYWWTSLEWPRPQFFRPRLAFLWHRGLTSGRGRKRTSCHLRPAKKMWKCSDIISRQTAIFNEINTLNQWQWDVTFWFNWSNNALV